MNTLHLNSVRLNGIGEVQSVSLSAGADPEQPPVGNYIQFEDPAVEAICVANWSSDGIGLTMEDAAAVTSLGTVFYNNTEITSFDELQYFTGASKNIPDNAFYGCTALQSIYLDNAISIGDSAFRDCGALTIALNAPNLKTLEFNAFKNSGITAISSIGKVTKLDAISYSTGIFENCKNLTSANLRGVTYIGYRIFYGCSILASIDIDWTKVTNLGPDSLGGCISLAMDELNAESLLNLGQNALNGVKIRKLNLGKVTTMPSASISTQNYGDKSVLEEVIIPEGVTSIPNYSFYNYTLVRTTIPKSVTTIGVQAFYACTAFTEVDLSSVVTIGKQAFDFYNGQMNLTGDVVLTSCETLTDYAFRNNKFKLVDMGANMLSIGSYVFANNNMLDAILCRAITPPTLANANAFTNTNNCPIYVPDASLEAYKTATNWSTYADRIHPLSEIEVLIEDGYELNNDGTLKESANYFVVGYIGISGEESITWGASSGAIGNLVEYDESGNYIDYWQGNSVDKRTITTKSSTKKIKACFLLSQKDSAYILDNTNSKYLWKGANVE